MFTIQEPPNGLHNCRGRNSHIEALTMLIWEEPTGCYRHWHYKDRSDITLDTTVGCKRARL